MRTRTGLLVSVRSAVEAEAALSGGADLIDVKEPGRGSLGRADDETILAVIRIVTGRRPVSAALGDIRDHPAPACLPGLTYAKWGLAGCANLPGADRCRQFLRHLQSITGIAPSFPFAVATAYADWERAAAPPPTAVLELAQRCECGVFLLDTFGKDGSTLLDWLPLPDLVSLRAACRQAGLRVAVAGSLGPREIERLRSLNPDWFAVRSAACQDGRHGCVDVHRVRALAALVHAGTSPVSDPLPTATSRPL